MDHYLNVLQPCSSVKAIQEITKRELEFGNEGKSSWYYQYKNSAYVYIGMFHLKLYQCTLHQLFTCFSTKPNSMT